MTIINKGYDLRGNIAGPARTSRSSYYGPSGPWYGTATVSTPGWSQVVNRWYRNWYSDTQWMAVREATGFLPTRGYSWHRQKGTQQPASLAFWSQYLGGGTHYWDYTELSGLVLPHWYDESDPPNALSSYDKSQLFAEAKTKALNKARDLKSSVPVFLAEGRKTVAMIAEAARKLAEAYNAFRHGNYRRVADLLGIQKPRGAANNWLEWAYGWRPLVQDLTGLAELAAQQLEFGGRKPRFRVSASAKRTGEKYITYYPLSSDAHSSWYTHSVPCREYIDKPSFSSRAWLLCEVKYTNVALASQLGFTPWDIAATAWELVPFSFVFDWFAQVGNALSSMSALDGLTVLDGGYSYQREYIVTEQTIGDWTWGGFPAYRVYGLDPFLQIKHHWYDRWTWSGDLPGTIVLKLFDGLGAQRILSAIALGFQQGATGRGIPKLPKP